MAQNISHDSGFEQLLAHKKITDLAEASKVFFLFPLLCGFDV